MKLTWFGNTAFRIHIGGQIVVVDPSSAPDSVDASEIVSGADHVVALGSGGDAADLVAWRPRPRERLLDAADNPRSVQVFNGGQGAIVLDADEDMPLLVISDEVPALGRWVEKAVVVLVGTDIAARGEALVRGASPRLIAIAGGDSELDAAFERLPALLDGSGLIALEPGLAVEV